MKNSLKDWEVNVSGNYENVNISELTKKQLKELVLQYEQRLLYYEAYFLENETQIASAELAAMNQLGQPLTVH